MKGREIKRQTRQQQREVHRDEALQGTRFHLQVEGESSGPRIGAKDSSGATSPFSGGRRMGINAANLNMWFSFGKKKGMSGVDTENIGH